MFFKLNIFSFPYKGPHTICIPLSTPMYNFQSIVENDSMQLTLIDSVRTRVVLYCVGERMCDINDM